MSEEKTPYMSERSNDDLERAISDFIRIENKIKEYKEERSNLVTFMVENFPGFNILITKNTDSTWTRIKIIDHLDDFDKGYYVPTKVSRYQVKIEILKNEPKELRGQDVQTNNTKKV